MTPGGRDDDVIKMVVREDGTRVAYVFNHLDGCPDCNSEVRVETSEETRQPIFFRCTRCSWGMPV